MDLHIGYIMTVSNSIIGVSILAMPYCFKQCGIILAVVMLLLSGMVSRLTCHYLLKSATMARRRTFELLSFHIFGTMGKLMVELGIIGFLMGTCVAFFVIIGDLGPAILAKMLMIENNDSLRTALLICLAIFCVVPLGLLKNVESLSSVSTATIGFYFCLVLKTIAESAPHFTSDEWLSNVELWKPHGILQCLPIFAMALSCQTQLFEIYETLPNASLEKMNYVVRSAVNICVAVYICVGFFGYVAFVNYQFTGNILMSFSPSVMTDAMKIGFVLSVACSFPLVIFPCRASLYSLLFKKGYTPYEGTTNFIPETRFKLLTLFIVGVSLIVGIMIPNIEVVLGLLGSTIGTMICVIFPVTCFICVSTKNTNERILAQIMLFIGVTMMVMGTYANLYAMEEINTAPVHSDRIQMPPVMPVVEAQPVNKERYLIDIKKGKVVKNPETLKKPIEIMSPQSIIQNLPENVQEIRKEPPQPVEPNDEVKYESVKNKNQAPILPQKVNQPVEKIDSNENVQTTKIIEVDKAAIEKEDNELKEEEKNKNNEDDKKADEILATLEKHKEEQQSLIQQQKELLEEIKKETKELKDKHLEDIEKDNELRAKAANQIVEIAKKAIESLGPKNENMKNAEQIIDNLSPKLNQSNAEQKASDKKLEEKVLKVDIPKVIVNEKLENEDMSDLKINKIKGNKNDVSKLTPESHLVPLPILINIRESGKREDKKVEDRIILHKNEEKKLENNVENKEIFLVDQKVVTEKIKQQIENTILKTNTTKINENNLDKDEENKKPKIKDERKEVKIGRDILEENEPITDKIEPNLLTEKVETTKKLQKKDTSKIGRDILGKIDAKTDVSQFERRKREINEYVKEKNSDNENKNCEMTENTKNNILMSLSHSDILKNDNNILNIELAAEMLKTHENLRRK